MKTSSIIHKLKQMICILMPNIAYMYQISYILPLDFFPLHPEYNLVILFLSVFTNLFCTVVPFKLKHYFLVGGGKLATFKD